MDFYRIIPLRENLWAISEVGKTVMYVINGQEKVLLLDTGFGLVPLRDVVRKLCGEKPIVVLNSHGHIDHNSGNNQFDTVYVGCYDEPGSHAQLTEEDRTHVRETYFSEFEKAGGVIPEWNPGPARQVIALREGDVFDLGGIRLEVLEAPGHSLGSVALFERERGWLFTGDLMLTWEVWGQLDCSTTLRVYGESIERLAALPGVTTVFPAHWEQEKNPAGFPECELPPRVLPMYADGIRRIVSGETPSVAYPFRGKSMRCVYFEIGGMAFDPDRLG